MLSAINGHTIAPYSEPYKNSLYILNLNLNIKSLKLLFKLSFLFYVVSGYECM
jgi:hypothetical protein